jgi:hypothetical protein
LWPAVLAQKADCNPRLVVGCAAMDQGVSSELCELKDAEPAGLLTFITWIAQLIGTVWLIVQVYTVWSYQEALSDGQDLLDAYIDGEEFIDTWNVKQLTQLVSTVTVNRGTWSIAVLGSLVPGNRLVGLYITTAIATATELVMLARAAMIAHDAYVFNEAVNNGPYNMVDDRLNLLDRVFPLIVVALETIVLIYGMF